MRHLRCLETGCTYVVYDPVDCNDHEEHHYEFNATEYIRAVIYWHILTHTVSAPEYVAAEPPADHDS